MKDLRILIACEESQAICKEFRALGFTAFSCDLLPCSGGHEEWHIQDDVSKHLEGWNLVVAHPTCFTKDTLVLTSEGYKTIDDIKIGDLVLTHNARFKKVTDIICKDVDEIVSLKISGSSVINTTREHPFYCRERISKFVKGKRNTTYNNPEWINAVNLNKKYRVGSVLPPETPTEIEDGLLWLMGRYVADGFLRYRDNRFEQLSIAIGKGKLEYFQKQCYVKARYYKKRTATIACIYNNNFVKQFAEFGMGAENKKIPGWVMSLPKDKAAKFLDGYLSGDGHFNTKNICASSVSKKLILGLSILFRRVFERPVRISYRKNPPTTIIEGRTVNQKDTYSIVVSNEAEKPKRALGYIDGDKTWYNFRKSEIIKTNEKVYNLSVEDDESYIVDNCIVHNCTFLSVSGARWMYNKDGSINQDRKEKQEKALDFVRMFMDAPCEHICIENPVSIISSRIRKPDQIIDPWMFGDSFSKKTCLWLKNLPLLTPTNIVDKGEFVTFKSGRRMSKWMAELRGNGHLRSKTFPGIAKAIAEQYGKFLIDKYK